MARENMTKDRRAEIVEVTTGLFLDSGFAGTSMSAVARACGITKATLYHHFPGKDDLFAACVTHGYAEALDRVQEIAASDRGPEDKLREAMEVLYDVTICSPVGRMSPLIAEVAQAFPNVARSFHDGYVAPQQALIARIVEDGVARGTFREIDHKLLSHVLMGPIVTLSLSREMFVDFEDLDDHFPIEPLKQGHVEMLLQALRPPG